MTQDSPTPAVEFDRFKLLAHRRELLADGQPVELGARAFDVLVALKQALDPNGMALTQITLENSVSVKKFSFPADALYVILE